MFRLKKTAYSPCASWS